MCRPVTKWLPLLCSLLLFACPPSPGVTTYTVTYHPNSATSGSVPVDGNHYAPGATVAVLGNTGNLIRDDHTFEG